MRLAAYRNEKKRYEKCQNVVLSKSYVLYIEKSYINNTEVIQIYINTYICNIQFALRTWTSYSQSVTACSSVFAFKQDTSTSTRARSRDTSFSAASVRNANPTKRLMQRYSQDGKKDVVAE